jgi:hypothetical protein
VDGAYVFRVRLRVEPSDPDVSLAPDTFETVLRKRAAEPGTDGWLFFRDNLWRAAVNDEAHLRALAAETLGVPVGSVDFRELAFDRGYHDALCTAIEANLDLFRADDVPEVLMKYLGSSIRIE